MGIVESIIKEYKLNKYLGNVVRYCLKSKPEEKDYAENIYKAYWNLNFAIGHNLTQSKVAKDLDMFQRRGWRASANVVEVIDFILHAALYGDEGTAYDEALVVLQEELNIARG